MPLRSTHDSMTYREDWASAPERRHDPKNDFNFEAELERTIRFPDEVRIVTEDGIRQEWSLRQFEGTRWKMGVCTQIHGKDDMDITNIDFWTTNRFNQGQVKIALPPYDQEDKSAVITFRESGDMREQTGAVILGSDWHEKLPGFLEAAGFDLSKRRPQHQ